MKRNPLPIIGWREWLALPDLGVDAIKAKVDTGARSSSLHAFDLDFYRRGNREFVRFVIHPLQKNNARAIEVRAPVLEWRGVKSSNGKLSQRPVILTTVRLFDSVWPIELTLANRDEMGFRMLLGREAIRRKFLVDPGKSFYAGRPERRKVKKARESK